MQDVLKCCLATSYILLPSACSFTQSVWRANVIGMGVPNPTELSYLQPYPSLSLADGLLQYRAANPHLLKEEKLPPEVGNFFHNHDLCHVVFGCTTSMRDEALADTWTMFGADISWKKYFAYLKQPEVVGILDEVGYTPLITGSIKAIPAIVAVIFRARSMKQKWPFVCPDAFMPKTVGSLRQEFGIRIYSQ